jgi:hypothetical protein
VGGAETLEPEAEEAAFGLSQRCGAKYRVAGGTRAPALLIWTQKLELTTDLPAGLGPRRVRVDRFVGEGYSDPLLFDVGY